MSMIILSIFIAIWLIMKVHGNIRSIENVIIGGNRGEANLLITLAESRGFFKKNGLNVILKEYDSGAQALVGLIQGDVDIAAAADYPFVIKSLENQNLRIMASIATITSNEIVVRKDRGITRPSDIRGKKIALLKGTTLEYYLKRFLLFNHITLEEVSLVPMPVSQLVESISEGHVDAATGWDLYVYEMMKLLGANAIRWPLQSEQDYYWLLISLEEKIKARPKVMEKFLNAMVDAEKFVQTSEQEAKAFLIDILNRESEYIEYVWEKYEYSTTLPQGLLIAMEDLAKDRLHAMPGQNKSIPNYLSFIDQEKLRAVKPQGIRILQ
jgi:NitT/TauT family transport system substrate-binding protein